MMGTSPAATASPFRPEPFPITRAVLRACAPGLPSSRFPLLDAELDLAAGRAAEAIEGLRKSGMASSVETPTGETWTPTAEGLNWLRRQGASSFADQAARASRERLALAVLDLARLRSQQPLAPPGVTLGGLAECTGLPVPDLQRALRQLDLRGLAWADGAGAWALTPAGVDAAGELPLALGGAA